MGVNIFNIVPINEIKISELANKIIIIDGNLALYQFLSSIRQSDGNLLTDSHGNVTSHLAGTFNRTLRLMSQNIKLVYVFDGKAPKLKEQERNRRRLLKETAQSKFDAAVARKDLEGMRKYAPRTSRLTRPMIDECTELITALGIPVVQAPSEGEAQAAAMVKNKDAYAVSSQDGDCFMYGATRLIKNLTINPRRKIPNRISYQQLSPELILLPDLLNKLQITQDQLIVLSMLIGTDFNIGGVKGIGPHKAIKLLKHFQLDFSGLFKTVNWSNFFDNKWEEVFNLIKEIPITLNYNLKWQKPDLDKVTEILSERHDFSKDRLSASMLKITSSPKNRDQRNLGEWFK